MPPRRNPSSSRSAWAEWRLDFPKYTKSPSAMPKHRKKAEMGRPPLPPDAWRSAVVTVRMTEAERERLEKEAKEAGLSISAYLLRCWHEKGS